MSDISGRRAVELENLSVPASQTQQADTDRQERLQKFAAERLTRVEAAKVARADELAQAETARLADARGKLAGFEDIGNASSANARARTKSRRKTLGKLALFVGLPSLIVGVYLTSISTPLYEAQTTLVVQAPETGGRRGDAGSGLFGTSAPGGLQDAFFARAYMLSPEMLAALDREVGFLELVAGSMVDPYTARRLPFLPGEAPLSTFNRFVKADVDIQEGLMTLRVRAPSAALATDWSRRILRLAGARIDAVGEKRADLAAARSRSDTAQARTRLGAARKRLTALQTGEVAANQSPAARTAMFDQARLDVELAQATWAERLRSEEAARLLAKRDRAVLTMISAPYAAARPASPEPLKSALLTALLLAGIYTFLTIIAASFRHHDLP